MRFFLTSCIFALLAGCATVPSTAPTYSRAKEPTSGESNVYVYRLGAYPILRTPTISIDGTAIIKPPERSYTYVPISEGRHEVGVNWAWDTGWPDLKFPITVVSGSPIYIKLSGSFEPQGTIHLLGSLAQIVDQSEAERELTSCCRYITPLKGATK